MAPSQAHTVGPLAARSGGRELRRVQRQAEATAKANNQASGNQKLLDLGLTQAEATALTGYTPPTEESE